MNILRKSKEKKPSQCASINKQNVRFHWSGKTKTQKKQSKLFDCSANISMGKNTLPSHSSCRIQLARKVKVYFATFIKLCLGQSSEPSVYMFGILFLEITSHFLFIRTFPPHHKMSNFCSNGNMSIFSQTVINKIGKKNSITENETSFRYKI